MCGPTGFVRFARDWSDNELADVACGMGSEVAHRGPDDAGVFTSAPDGIGLAHHRLSIIDLSPAGRQPMTTPDGRYTIVYNGELYNAAELTEELQALARLRFRGHSDTEVVLHALAAWGPAALRRLNGMFALALWDARERVLTLARDPLGEKPLYYGWHGGSFLFGSELKALSAHPDFRREVDDDAIELFFHYGYIPAPKSAYRGIAKLLPGSWLQVDSRRAADRSAPRRFWSASEVVGRAAAERKDLDLEELEGLVHDAVRRRMVADVPVGAFLSGGIDSTTIVAAMQAESSRPVKTFTVGFDVAGFDESAVAREVSAHLGTDHHELRVDATDVLSVIPLLPTIYDEPFADSSQLPTYLIARLAKQTVNVALSGDGGDEVFGGYQHYGTWPQLWDLSRRLPRPVRRLTTGVTRVRPQVWERAASPLARLGVLSDRLDDRVGERLAKTARLVGSDSIAQAYVALNAQWPTSARVVRHGRGTDPPAPDVPPLAHAAECFMFADTVTYLPDDILVKVDRASMAVGLEVRVPFLDTRVLEAAWRLPLGAKLDGTRGKLPLRALLRRHVPEHLVERPKSGFLVPIGQWLRGPLRGWADDLLSEPRLRSEGYLDTSAVRRCWAKHQATSGRWDQQLWNVLMFEAWLQAQASVPARPHTRPLPATRTR